MNHLKCTIQWHFATSQCCGVIVTSIRFLHLQYLLFFFMLTKKKEFRFPVACVNYAQSKCKGPLFVLLHEFFQVVGVMLT